MISGADTLTHHTHSTSHIYHTHTLPTHIMHDRDKTHSHPNIYDTTHTYTDLKVQSPSGSGANPVSSCIGLKAFNINIKITFCISDFYLQLQ